MDPVTDARALVASRFPQALQAFLAANEARTPTSDLDVVVVLPDLAVPYRESLRWRGTPVELFVHGELSLHAYLEREFARRRPSLPRMCGHGTVLIDRLGTAPSLRSALAARLAAGPGPSPDLDRLRYGLADLIDDLAGAKDPGELMMIRSTVVEAAARLRLASLERWEGSGKWLMRELRSADHTLAEQLVAAHADPARLWAVATRVVEETGGRLWEGYHAEGDPFHQRLLHVTPSALSSETAQSSGMHRLAAIAGAGRLWMGQTLVAPATASADHHHGHSETAIFVVRGNPSFVFADGRIDTRPGDYVFVPPYVPHREENPSPDDDALVVIARSTPEAIVVNLPGLRLPPPGALGSQQFPE